MPDIRNALTEVMDLEHQGSDDEMQPLRPEHHQSRSAR